MNEVPAANPAGSTENAENSARTITFALIIDLLTEDGQLIEAASCADPASMHITGMSFDSRETAPGHLFVCKGVHFEPRFLTAAREAGAAAYLCDRAHAEELAETAPGMPRIVAEDVRRAMALCAPAVYGHPDRSICITGITGTKGKSTTAYMLRSILDAAERPCGIMGSIMTDDGIECYESHNTTPEAPELWRHLANTAASGRDSMVMEVSSHALKYDRVLGLPLDIACFLNIGRDHISPVEHEDFEDYFTSKLRIFEQCGIAVVNLGTAECDRVLNAAGAAERVVCFGVEGTGEFPAAGPEAGLRLDETADVWATDVESGSGRITFTLHESAAFVSATTCGNETGERVVPVALGIPGLFNVDNALAAICMARLMGADTDAILAGLANLRVPGRMEVVRNADESIIAIVDYAHNKLSFEALFDSVSREYAHRQVIAVFGAPGGKAYERREQLPKAAAPHSDLLIFTEEDPAHDSVREICEQMAAATPAGTPYEIIEDREAAITHAVDIAKRDFDAGICKSVLLLLAKGDETRQHRGDEYPEVKSDLQIARELLEG